MSRVIKFVASSLLAGMLATAVAQELKDQKGCGVVVRAIEAARTLKSGMSRSDVEKGFLRDGGVQFREKTTYVYRDCDYIKIDVEFATQSDTPKGQLHPNDRIVSVSRPYLAYPTMD